MPPETHAIYQIRTPTLCVGIIIWKGFVVESPAPARHWKGRPLGKVIAQCVENGWAIQFVGWDEDVIPF